MFKRKEGATEKEKEVNSIIRGKSREGEKCCNWKGGKKVTDKGYILISKRGYPTTDANGYIFEHRYIMCEYLGRILRNDEIVHHINGKKQDNRIENLKVMTNSEHTIFHNTKINRRKKVV